MGLKLSSDLIIEDRNLMALNSKIIGGLPVRMLYFEKVQFNFSDGESYNLWCIM